MTSRCPDGRAKRRRFLWDVLLACLDVLLACLGRVARTGASVCPDIWFHECVRGISKAGPAAVAVAWPKFFEHLPRHPRFRSRRAPLVPQSIFQGTLAKCCQFDLCSIGTRAHNFKIDKKALSSRHNIFHYRPRIPICCPPISSLQAPLSS